MWIWSIQNWAFFLFALATIRSHLPIVWSNKTIRWHELCLTALLMYLSKMLGCHGHLRIQLFSCVDVGGWLVSIRHVLVFVFRVCKRGLLSMLCYCLWLRGLVLVGVAGWPHAHRVHLVHLLVGTCRSISLDHVNSSLPLSVESAFWKVWRVHADWLHSLYLFLALALPVPNVVGWLARLEPLKHCFILDQDPVNFSIPLTIVQRVVPEPSFAHFFLPGKIAILVLLNRAWRVGRLVKFVQPLRLYFWHWSFVVYLRQFSLLTNDLELRHFLETLGVSLLDWLDEMRLDQIRLTLSIVLVLWDISPHSWSNPFTTALLSWDMRSRPSKNGSHSLE